MRILLRFIKKGLKPEAQSYKKEWFFVSLIKTELRISQIEKRIENVVLLNQLPNAHLVHPLILKILI